ncbi:MAG: FG-GAP repeat protein, partial [Acidobacteriota bacterium]
MDYRVFPSRIALVNLFLAAAHLVACSDDEGPTPPTVGDDDPGADGGTGGPGTGGDGGDSAESFRVTYSANGADRGTVPRDEQGYGAGTTVTVLDNEGDLARADYPFFSGWNSAADGGGESYSGGEPLVMPEGGITLYATWLDEAKLLAPRGGAEDYFGAQIDVQGDYAIIASIEETGGGFVSIHQRTGANDWDDGFRIETEEGSSDFGSSVLLVDDYALVGASRSGQYGAVFVYRRTGANEWTKHDTLTPPDDSAASFGSSLVANGDRLFIGDDGDGDAGRAAGAVHVYRRVAAGTWAHRQKITPQGDGDFDLESGQFGHSLDVDGEHLVVGVRGRFLPSGNRAYFLSETDLGWQHVASVTEGPDDSNFGNSVAIQGEFAIIGASWTNDDSGAVYVYQR